MTEEKPKANAFIRGVKFFFKLCYGYFAMIGLLMTFSMVSAMIFLASAEKSISTGTDIELPAQINLQMELSGEILQSEPDEFEAVLFKVFGKKQGIYLPSLRAALRRANTDDRVKRMDIEIGSIKASMAEVEELRRILKEFADTGKQLQVVLNEPTDWNYYVATAANRIIINPASTVELFGPAFHLIYFGEALRKLGVDIEVIRHGKYKSAFEPFVQNKPSEPTLEQYRSMEESLRDVVIGRLAEGRSVDPSEVEKWLKQSLFTAEQAIQSKIIDGIGYFSQGATTGDGKNDYVALADYGNAMENVKNPMTADDKVSGIALITAIGEISMTKDGNSGDGIAPDSIREEIRWAKENKDAKAVVIRISSPGGSAVASDMIWREIRELVAVKPVVVSMGAVAASGGYYIAAPATQIFAEPTTITGSIGVIGMLPNFTPFEEKYGVSFHIVSNSDRQAMISMGSKSTGQDKEMIQTSIDQVYKVFIEKVAEGRNMDVETVHALGQGRVYTGAQALKIKLVDRLGGLQDAFAAAKTLGGLDPAKLYAVHTYSGEGLDFRKCFSSSKDMMRCLKKISVKAPSFDAPIPFGNDPMQKTVASLQRWMTQLEREKTLALWPGYLSLPR